MAQVQRTPSVSERASNPYNLYQTISQIFWNAEHQLQKRVDLFSVELSPYKSPLAKTDPLYQKYFQVDQDASQYIKILDANKEQSWTLPPVLYLGGIAAFTIGDYANAQKYLSLLLQNHPNYKRSIYIGDNYTPDPDSSQPVKPGVSKLLFYVQLQSLTSHVTNDIASFQQFNTTSIKVLSTEVAFATWLANRPNPYQRREFYEDDYGEEPDQLRASVLPTTAKLIEDGWQQLFPAALKKSGALAMRKYLRTLTTEDSSLQDIAEPRLEDVDQLIIKSYFAQAKVLLAHDNFAATRAKYKQIIAEYPKTDAASRAETELPKVVPVAVNYYKKEGDANFKTVDKMGVPQDKSAAFYSKMYSEDPNGPKADYALYYWARALGTEGKAAEEVKLLQQHLTKFPHSKMQPDAMYLLAFAYSDHGMRNYKLGIPLLLEVVKKFPRSEQAPEALWNAAFLLAWNQQFKQAIPLLQQLKKQYPKSPRTKWVDQWIAKYQEVMKTGAKWP